MDNTQPSIQIENIPVYQGLSLEDVNILLLQKHGLTVPKHDPLLMLVTINNAYLHDLQKLLNTHNKALTTIMDGSSTTTIKAIQDEARIFTMDFKDAAITNTLAKVTEHQRAMDTFLGVQNAHVHELKIYASCVLGASILFLLITLGVFLWTR